MDKIKTNKIKDINQNCINNMYYRSLYWKSLEIFHNSVLISQTLGIAWTTTYFYRTNAAINMTIF